MEVLEERENVWEWLLDDITREKGMSRNTSIVVLGEPNAGKRSLIKVLQNRQPQDDTSDAFTIAGLGYSYLETQVEDLQVKVNMWAIDDINNAGDLLASAVLPDAETALNSLAILVVDLEKPWDAMKCVKGWTEVLEDHIESLGHPELKTKCEEYLLQVAGRHQDMEVSCLSKGTLERNIGLRILVVASKSDLVENVSNDVESEMRLEFIQRHLRSFCLSVGASCTFLSSHSGINCSLFQEYMMYRLYPDLFPTGTLTTLQNSDPKCVHIPAGVDRLDLIGALAVSNTQRFESWVSAEFAQVIKEPRPEEQVLKESEIDPEDVSLSMYDFFTVLLDKQSKLPAPIKKATMDAAEVALNAFDANASSFQPGIVAESTTPTPAARVVSAADVQDHPEVVLNFFQNLLNKEKS